MLHTTSAVCLCACFAQKANVVFIRNLSSNIDVVKLKNIDEILIDHAHCELKAASTTNSLIMSFPEYSDLVTEMVSLVKEEMSVVNRIFTETSSDSIAN